MEFANRAINVIVYAILLCRDADTNIKFISVYSFIVLYFLLALKINLKQTCWIILDFSLAFDSYSFLYYFA